MKWWVLWALGAVGSVVVAGVQELGPLQLLLCTPLRLVGVVAVLVAARRLRARDPGADTGWWWIAAGISTWLVGDLAQVSGVAWTWGFSATGLSSVYLCAYPSLVVGLVVLTRRASSRGERLGGLLEGAAVSTSLALAGLVLTVGPALAATTGGRLGQVVDVAFTAGDVLLIALATCLVSVSRPLPLALLAAAGTLPLVLLSDCLWLLVPLGSGLEGALASAHLLSHLSWASAAVAVARSAAATSGPTASPADRFAVETEALSPRRLGVLAVAGVLPAVVLGLVPRPPAGGGYGWVVVLAVVLGALVPLLVLLRLVEALRAVRSAARAVEVLRRDLEHQATHDALTGLANRPRVRTLLAQALTATGTGGATATVGLLFIDLDGFKAVNDTLGHRAGDEVLRLTAARAAAAVRASDAVGRLGGDEFVVVLPDLEDDEQLVAIGRRLVTELSRPLHVEGRTVSVGASIGAATAPCGDGDGASAADALLHEADQAVYCAKARGKGRVVVFDGAARARATGAGAELSTPAAPERGVSAAPG